MPISNLKNLYFKPKIILTNVNLTSFSDGIQILGKSVNHFELRNASTHTVYYWSNTMSNCYWSTCKEIYVLKGVFSVSNSKNILDSFSDIFIDLGFLSNTSCHISVDLSVIPVVDLSHKFPLLKRKMVSRSVIFKVTQP